MPNFTSKQTGPQCNGWMSTLALEARCYIQANEEWGPSGLADWGGEECEGDKVQPEHRVGEKSQLDDTLTVFFLIYFCTDI